MTVTQQNALHHGPQAPSERASLLSGIRLVLANVIKTDHNEIASCVHKDSIPHNNHNRYQQNPELQVRSPFITRGKITQSRSSPIIVVCVCACCVSSVQRRERKVFPRTRNKEWQFWRGSGGGFISVGSFCPLSRTASLWGSNHPTKTLFKKKKKPKLVKKRLRKTRL